MKWSADQREGYLGWEPSEQKGLPEQPRWVKAQVDIDEALADTQVCAVLDAWESARMFEGVPAYSGGLLDTWPALMVDGLAICRQEETAIGDFVRWKEEHDA